MESPESIPPRLDLSPARRQESEIPPEIPPVIPPTSLPTSLPVLHSDAGIPPVLAHPHAPHPGPVRPRWRSVAFLLLVGFYPLILGVLSRFLDLGGAPRGPALPPTIVGLVTVCLESVAIFALFFGAGAWVGRPTRKELFWHPMRLWDWIWGALWSVGVRLGAVAVVYGALAPFLMVEALKSKAAGGGAAGPSVEERLQEFRPKLESLLQFDALADPLYLFLAVTLLSFLTAGLREELWRAGFMAAVRDLLPRSWWAPCPRKPSEPWLRWQLRRRGPTVLVAGLAAVIFGLGHLPQGVGGVILTGVVGFILALVMMGHRSLWAAVIAHGFFDASTFVLLAVIVWNKEWIQRMAPDLLKQLGM